VKLQGQLHLIIGPVGAGKSTFARALSEQHRAVPLILDDWMAQLFGADQRPEVDRIAWYLERRDRCLEQIWKLTTALCAVQTPVVLEIWLLQRRDREEFYRRVDDAGYDLTVYVLDVPREIRRERVMRRNAEQGPTFAQVVPLELFELASDVWEPPDDDEVRDHAIRFP
jgi:predicted kinase